MPKNENDEKGDKTVPLAALQAETSKRQALQTEVAELRGRVEGLATVARPAASSEPAKDLTRAQLRQAVTDEKITQDEADDIADKQTENRITANATAAATSAVSSATLGSKVQDQISRYKAAIPDLADKDSAAYQKVTKEFAELTDLGHDSEDLRTEVAALRAAFGDIETLTKTGKPGERQTFQETGGSGDGEGGESNAWPKAMNAGQRAYYDDLIAKGVMADKTAALEEFNYKPKHRPARGRAA